MTILILFTIVSIFRIQQRYTVRQVCLYNNTSENHVCACQACNFHISRKILKTAGVLFGLRMQFGKQVVLHRFANFIGGGKQLLLER